MLTLADLTIDENPYCNKYLTNILFSYIRSNLPYRFTQQDDDPIRVQLVTEIVIEQ